MRRTIIQSLIGEQRQFPSRVEVDIGFKRGTARMIYVVPVNRDAAFRIDGMDEVIRFTIPKSLRVIGLTEYGIRSAVRDHHNQEGKNDNNGSQHHK